MIYVILCENDLLHSGWNLYAYFGLRISVPETPEWVYYLQTFVEIFEEDEYLNITHVLNLSKLYYCLQLSRKMLRR